MARGAFWGIIVGLAASAVACSTNDRLESELGLPFLFRMRGPTTPPESVYVVAIDRKSTDELGLLPLPRDWPRAVHARIIDALAARGAGVIAYDIVFERPGDDAGDRELERAIEKSDRTVLAENRVTRTVPIDGSLLDAPQVVVEERHLPLPTFARAALAVAPFPLPRVPAMVDRFWAYRPESGRAPTLPVAALVALADRPDAPVDVRCAAERVRHGPEAYWLWFYGPPGTVRTISLSQLLTAPAPGDVLLPDLAGTAAFVGYAEHTFPTKDDSFDTAFTREDGVALSGVEIAATAFANLLTGTHVAPLPPVGNAFLSAVLGCALGACVFALRPSRAILMALATAAGWVLLALMAFRLSGLWLPVVTPVLLVVPGVLFAGLLHRNQHLERLIDILVPSWVLALVRNRPGNLPNVRLTRFATLLATDAQGFTTFAQNRHPTETSRQLNAYFAAIEAPVRARGADFFEFHADSTLLAWTVDAADSSVRQQACLGALEVLEEIRKFRTTIAPHSLDIRIGLHAGWVSLGSIGAPSRIAVRLTGEAVTIASRLEGLNRHLGTRLLATDDVVANVPGLLLRPLGRFHLVGRTAPVSIVEIVSTQRHASMTQLTLCRAFADALRAYEARRWTEALNEFAALVDEYPSDGPSRVYLAETRKRHCPDRSGLSDEPIRFDSK